MVTVCCVPRAESSPLMAGGGDPVSGVELLSFPLTRAGCRFEALIAMFQKAGENQKNKTFSVFLCLASDRVTPLSVTVRSLLLKLEDPAKKPQ